MCQINQCPKPFVRSLLEQIMVDELDLLDEECDFGTLVSDLEAILDHIPRLDHEDLF